MLSSQSPEEIVVELGEQAKEEQEDESGAGVALENLEEDMLADESLSEADT